jgi:phenylalanyl-tRNA synthetase alpha chain
MSEACENMILTHLASSSDAVISDSYEWSALHGLDHNEVVGAMKSLMVEDYVQSSDLVSTFSVLSSEAEGILLHGSQEMMVMAALLDVEEDGQQKCSRGLTVADLQQKLGSDVCKIGMGNCLKNKWAKKDGDRIVPLKNNLDDVVDEVKASLQILVENKGSMDALGEKVRFSHCFPVVFFSPFIFLCINETIPIVPPHQFWTVCFLAF